MKYDSRLSKVAPRLSAMASCVVLGFGATASMPVGSASTYLAAPARTPQARNNQAERSNPPITRQPRGHFNRQQVSGPAPERSSGAPRGGGIITVSNCNDAGAGSLRQALDDAADGDTVDLTGLTCDTILLTSGRLERYGEVTIQGPGRDQLTIDGNASDLVLRHSGGDLTIHGLTLANGRTADGAGGCTWIDGNLEMVDSRVSGCVAGDGTNSHAYGAGLDVIGDLTLVNSIVTGNSATNSPDDYYGYGFILGGGVYVGGSAMLKYGSQISGNTANAQVGHARGGGLFAHGGVVVIGAVIEDNRVEAPGTAYGGGFHSNTEGALFGSTVSGNTAHSRERWSYGGGIQIGDDGSYVSGSLLLANSTISGNTSSADCSYCLIQGGGAHAFGGMSAKYSTINDNAVLSAANSEGTARGGGLAIWSYYEVPQLVLLNSTVSGNRAIGGTQGYGYGHGGGIAAITGAFAVFNSTVAFNTASHIGGGITGEPVYGPVDPHRLSSSIVSNNQAPENPDIASRWGNDYPLDISGSHNLVTVAGSSANLPGDTLDDDPLLQPLAMNGGPTATHALGESSPAIDAGANPEDVDYDQRGAPFVRVFGAAADIGAFEVQPDPYPIFSDGFED